MTAYALHLVYGEVIGKAVKTSPEQAIGLLESGGNSATTWLWDYATGKWAVGEPVHIAHGDNGKYLCSNRNDSATNHLTHLISFDWIVS